MCVYIYVCNFLPLRFYTNATQNYHKQDVSVRPCTVQRLPSLCIICSTQLCERQSASKCKFVFVLCQVSDGSPEYPEAEAEEGAAPGMELFQVRRRSSRNLQLPPLVFRQAEQHDWNSKETALIARPTTLALRTPPLIAITSADAGR